MASVKTIETFSFAVGSSPYRAINRPQKYIRYTPVILPRWYKRRRSWKLYPTPLDFCCASIFLTSLPLIDNVVSIRRDLFYGMSISARACAGTQDGGVLLIIFMFNFRKKGGGKRLNSTVFFNVSLQEFSLGCKTRFLNFFLISFLHLLTFDVH